MELGFTPLSTMFQSYRGDQLLVQEKILHHQDGDVHDAAKPASDGW